MKKRTESRYFYTTEEMKAKKGTGLRSLWEALFASGFTNLVSSNKATEESEGEKTLIVYQEFEHYSGRYSNYRVFRKKTGRRHWQWWLIIPILLLLLKFF